MTDRSIARRAAFASVGLALAAAASPSLARPNADPTIPAPAAISKIDAKPQRYCVTATVTGKASITGSILARKECHTRDEWAARGVAIPTK